MQSENEKSLNRKGIEELTEDYTHEPVPAGINTTGLKVAMVICAIGITLPAIWVSSDMAIQNGFIDANIAFWVGNAIVAFISLFTGIVGSRSRLSTYMIIQFSFGKTGAKVANALMAITLLGWYAVTIEVFGVAIADGLKELLGITISIKLAVVLSSVFMTATTIFGYSMVERFSIYSVPLLAAFMLYVAYIAFGSSGDGLFSNTPEGGQSMIALLSTVIGMASLTAVLMPDFTRYCDTDRQSHIASLVGIGITYPLVMTMASVPAVVSGEADFIVMMIGMGVVFAALVVLVFATWSTNITNLYSSTLTLATFLPKVPNWKITIIGSAVATAFATAGVMDYFIDFLILIGITGTPLAGIYVVDFFLVKKGNYSMERLGTIPAIGFSALAAWAIACAVGYASQYGIFTLSPLSALDSLFAAAVAYFVLTKIMPEKTLAHSKA